MIEYRTGNILTAKADALVNTVNCVGVMGRGVALEFKRAFPDNFKAYADACRNHQVQPGRMFVHEANRLDGPTFIINFPTKRHWRQNSRMEDIESGLTALIQEVESRNITSIAIPPLGSGLGGLNWRHVRARIESSLGELAARVHIIVYEPSEQLRDRPITPLDDMPNMTVGRAALVMAMQSYAALSHSTPITLLELHKLLYLLQEGGQPLNLRYEKGQYGPFAKNLRHLLLAIEGHFLSGFTANGDPPSLPLNVIPEALDDASSIIEDATDTKHRLDRVSSLVEEYATPDGLELLATIHWVVSREHAITTDQAIELVKGWNERKNLMFSCSRITAACNVLASANWFPSTWISEPNVQIPFHLDDVAETIVVHPMTPPIFECLKFHASQNRTLTYKELGEEVGITARSTIAPVRNIGRICAARRLPELNALVVRVKDRLPSSKARTKSLKIDRQEHVMMLGRVYGFDWSSVYV